MNCPKCNTVLVEGASYCHTCGSRPDGTTPINIPENYKPLNAWAYFGLSLLFSVPIVGFIFLIVFSFSRGNINRRSFARSYWCMLLIVGIIVLLLATLGVAAGIGLNFM